MPPQTPVGLKDSELMQQTATSQTKPLPALWRLLALALGLTVVGLVGSSARTASAFSATSTVSSVGHSVVVGLETRVGVTNHFSRGSSARLATIPAACVGEIRPGYDRIALVSCVATKTADDLVDLSSPARRRHILDGDATGGGHRWPGASGKTPFPKGWSDDVVMHEVADIATDPALKWKWTKGAEGSSFTKAGDPSRVTVHGVRRGVCNKVSDRVLATDPETGLTAAGQSLQFI
jgi:hypothetical protein